MELLKFKKSMFERNFPKGWHLMNTAAGQPGEYTMCGIAFDGDVSTSEQAETKSQGSVTCEDCLAVIRLCKSIKL